MITFLYYLNNVGLLLSIIFLGLGVMDGEPLGLLLMMQFVIGVYQMFISLIMIFLRKLTNSLLDYHFILSCLYLMMLFGMSMTTLEIDESAVLTVLPWTLALLFTMGIRKASNRLYEQAEYNTEDASIS